jgi:F-type H+-transporting ATPase subunit delta
VADSTVAHRYASALLDLALPTGELDRVAKDLGRFGELLRDPGVRRALVTPLFASEERSRVLGALLPRLGLHPLAANFLRLLDEKHRFGDIDAILEAFARLADEASGRVRVEVATAEPMSPQIEAEVRATLERGLGRKVLLTAKVEPELIGGMVARVGSKVYDSSLRTRLENLKLNLLNSQSPAQA